MKIIGISILPPLAIGRLGSAREPLENYELELPPDGLGYRRITPAETLYVDKKSGAIIRAGIPSTVQFPVGTK